MPDARNTLDHVKFVAPVVERHGADATLIGGKVIIGSSDDRIMKPPCPLELFESFYIGYLYVSARRELFSVEALCASHANDCINYAGLSKPGSEAKLVCGILGQT